MALRRTPESSRRLVILIGVVLTVAWAAGCNSQYSDVGSINLEQSKKIAEEKGLNKGRSGEAPAPVPKPVRGRPGRGPAAPPSPIQRAQSGSRG